MSCGTTKTAISTCRVAHGALYVSGGHPLLAVRELAERVEQPAGRTG